MAVSRPTYCLLFHNFAFNQVCAAAAATEEEEEETVRAALAPLPRQPPLPRRNAYPPPSRLSPTLSSPLPLRSFVRPRPFVSALSIVNLDCLL